MWFSNIQKHQTLTDRWLKHTEGLISTNSKSIGLGLGPGICISATLLGDADTAGTWTTFENYWFIEFYKIVRSIGQVGGSLDTIPSQLTAQVSELDRLKFKYSFHSLVRTSTKSVIVG